MMGRIRCALIAIACCVPAVDAAARPHEPKNTDPVVLSELSRRSSLPEKDLRAILADCNVNQQSLYFCAFRDFVAADLAFRRLVSVKQHRLPSCRAAIGEEAANAERLRDSSCEKSATADWGDGSMKPTAAALCAASETRKMTARFRQRKSCRDIPAPSPPRAPNPSSLPK